MKTQRRHIFLFPIIFFLFAIPSFSQQVSIGLFPLQSSTFLAELKSKKSENPKITAKELAAAGNELINNIGINYRFELSQSNCTTLLEMQKKLKPEQKLSALRGKFAQPQGEPTTLLLPDVTFTSNCGCYIEIPSLSVTETDFVTKIRGVNIKFTRPSNFKMTVELVDNTNLTKVVRRWYIPYPTIPIGVYTDGTILFLDFPDSELSELALAIYDSGTIQVVSKNDWELKEKAVKLKDFPIDANNPNLTFISFGEGAKKRTLRFNQPCN